MKHKFLIITGLVMSVLVLFQSIQLFYFMPLDTHDTIVIPGWHTAIFPIHSFLPQIMMTIIAILQLGYWIIWLVKKWFI